MLVLTLYGQIFPPPVSGSLSNAGKLLLVDRWSVAIKLPFDSILVITFVYHLFKNFNWPLYCGIALRARKCLKGNYYVFFFLFYEISWRKREPRTPVIALRLFLGGKCRLQLTINLILVAFASLVFGYREIYDLKLWGIIIAFLWTRKLHSKRAFLMNIMLKLVWSYIYYIK